MATEAVSWAFSKMMFLGNVHGALNFLSQNISGLPLKLSDVIQTNEGTTESVLNILESLHPEEKPLANEALLSSTLPNALPAYPVIFEDVDGNIRARPYTAEESMPVHGAVCVFFQGNIKWPM